MDYKILKYYRREKDQVECFLVQCNICYHQKEMTKHNYDSAKKNKNGLCHNGTNCKEDYYDFFIGKKFGDYVVDKREGKRYFLHCEKCGTQEQLSLYSLQNADKHNHFHGVRCFKNIPDSEIKQAINRRFSNIKQRCSNPNSSSYKYYGEKGIICDYKFVVDFYLDFYEEFSSHAKKYGIRNSTFDRIDVNKGYTKENLRVTTMSIQTANTHRKRLFILEKEGERVLSDNMMEFGRHFGVNGRAIGNLVRGTSKTAGGWRLYKIVPVDSDIEEIVKKESVTTKLITT